MINISGIYQDGRTVFMQIREHDDEPLVVGRKVLENWNSRRNDEYLIIGVVNLPYAGRTVVFNIKGEHMVIMRDVQLPVVK